MFQAIANMRFGRRCVEGKARRPAPAVRHRVGRAARRQGRFRIPPRRGYREAEAPRRFGGALGCNTAGSGGTGESLSGLARAFFQAGAHGLLVTHWNVVTGASVPLMVGTFGNGSVDSGQALRIAQLRMIDGAGSSPQAPVEISHPNYWAAFILIGDGVRVQPGA